MIAGAMLWYIAVIGDQIVGRIKVLFQGQTGEPTIFALRVKDEKQRQGIGAQLIKEAEKGLREKDISHLLLSVVRSEGQLIEWYQKMGYQLIGERTDHWYFIQNGEQINYELEVYDFVKKLDKG